MDAAFHIRPFAFDRVFETAVHDETVHGERRVQLLPGEVRKPLRNTAARDPVDVEDPLPSPIDDVSRFPCGAVVALLDSFDRFHRDIPVESENRQRRPQPHR